jgi:hypothetical protein
MAAATLGELLRPAREQLEAAAGSSTGLRGESVTAVARTVGGIARTLSRYLADIAPYRVTEAIIAVGLDERAGAVVAAREAMRMVAASLCPGGEPAGEARAGAPDPLVAHLEAASTGLTAGRDLLRPISAPTLTGGGPNARTGPPSSPPSR